MSNSKDFKADSYQVGELQRALRSSIYGDLMFTDEFFPAGVRLRDFTTSQLVYAITEATSAGLQVQITANKDDISLLDGRVTINEVDIEALKTTTQAISSFSSSFLGLTDTPDSYSGFNSYVLSVSGNSIVFTNLNSIVSGVESQIIAISGDLESLQSQVSAIVQESTSITGNSTITIGQTGSNFSLSVNDYIGSTTVSAISSNLQSQLNNLDLNFATNATLASISGNLQSQINNLDSTYVTDSSFVAITGNLQQQIDNIVQETTTITGDSTLTIGQTGANFSLSVNDYIGSTTVNAISSNLQAQLNNLDLNFATDATLSAISGNLQQQIDNIVQETTTITGNSTITIGQTGANFSLSVNDYIGSTTVNAISSNLQAQLNNLDLNFATDATLSAISGNLQSQIDNLDLNFATDASLEAVSGNLQQQIDNIVQETTTITGDSTLTIGQTGANFSLSVADYISATEVYGISGELQSNISNLAKKGVISLNTTDYIYTISNANIESTSYPICSLIAPSQDSSIYPFYVFDIAAGSFKVELSDTPAISGYKLSWLVI